jgi:hypothetical protein
VCPGYRNIGRHPPMMSPSSVEVEPRRLGPRAPAERHPLGPLEVGQHQDVEQLGAGGGAEGIETLS